MTNKLYTTYLSKMKDVPENTMKAIIMRFPPFIKESDDIFHCPELSPTNEIFSPYLKSKDWDRFELAFKNQLNTNSDTTEFIDLLINALDNPNGNNVCLVCCEKDITVCHRRLIAEYLKSLGYEWEEL